MWSKNQLTEQLGLQYPIIQGPMSGASSAQLVAAVCQSGCLGSLGAAQLSPDKIRQEINMIRSLTDKPFAVNLFVPTNAPFPNSEAISAMNKLLNSFRNRLGISESPSLTANTLKFEDQLQVIIEEKVPIFSFTFGILEPEIIRKIKKHSIIVIGTATTVREAHNLENAGVDIIVASGSESGGHRGSAADTPITGSLIGTLALVPQIVDQVKLPVIAAGGIMDGRGIVAAIALGASGVQMGTAFLTCTESAISPAYKQSLLAAKDETTAITCSYTGRWARGIYNEFMQKMAQHQTAVLPYPYQRFLTQDIVNAAKQQNNKDLMMMWAGQATALCRSLAVQDFIATLIKETDDTLSQLQV